MKMLLGLTPPTSGTFTLFDQTLTGHEKQLYPRIGALIETPGFYPNLTGTENLEIFARLRNLNASHTVKNALETVGLPFRDKKLFREYSLGMKQRLGLANALLHHPQLLILDEPTNGLDPIGIAEIRDFLKTLCKDHGKTILVSSHILSEICLLYTSFRSVRFRIFCIEPTHPLSTSAAFFSSNNPACFKYPVSAGILSFECTSTHWRK